MENNYLVGVPMFPVVFPFSVNTTNKEQALKVLEEASELVEAVKCDGEGNLALEEFADVLQALANLAKLNGWTPAMIANSYSMVLNKNLKRGRYRATDLRPIKGGKEVPAKL